MRPMELMADVLPPAGNGLYCVAAITGPKKLHYFADDLSDVKGKIKEWLGKRYNVYFALATFDPVVLTLTKARRTAQNARMMRALFIDMDGYETKAKAGAALFEFLSKTGLDAFGTPHIVSSGGGLHCYWPLTEAVDITTWRPVAENLKRLCAQEKLVIDNTVTADAARILRVPGTLNFKPVYPTPREVKLLQQGTGAVDLKKFSAVIRGLLKDEFAPPSNSFAPDALALAGAPPRAQSRRQTNVLDAMLGNRASRFETIWLKTERGEGCAQLQYYADHAQQDGMEPLWRATLSWAKHCTDSEEAAVKLSQLHPYDEARMRQKLAEIKGPYACAKLDSENPGVCPSCPHWGKITNPLALGREVLTHTDERQIIVPTNTLRGDKDDAAVEDDEPEAEDDNPDILQTRKVTIPPPPKGFSYGKHGGVYVELRETDPSGVTIKTQVEVLAHDLFVVDMLRMEDGEHRVHLMAIKPAATPDGAPEHISVIMPSKAVVAKDDLLKSLASNNIYASNGAVMDAHLFNYVRGCVNDAARMKRAVSVPVQFGWQKDRSFVYNNRVFRADGTEVIVPMPGLENLNRATTGKGTIEDWRRPWEMLIERELYALVTMCLDSFGSTLMHFSNYEGFVWHIGSTASGTGKSLTLSLKAGVWGHPIRYRTSSNTSPVAMQQRAGLLNSLPLLVDEVTSKARHDVEWAPAFIFDFAEGQGKERMEASSNKERLNNTTWASTCTMTSNVHMSDLLVGSRKHSSQGEMMRMLEITPTKELQFSDEERGILMLLRHNYGVAGEAWVRWCVQNYGTVREVWNTVHQRLRTELNFSDEERYWHAACTNVVAAAILLGPHYTDLLTVPVKQVVATLKEWVKRGRGLYKAAVRSAEDILNAYIREHHGQFVVLRREADGTLLTDLGVDLASKTSTRSVIMGRVEHGTLNSNYVEFYVEEALLRRHCAAMSFGYADLRNGMIGLQSEGFSVRFSVKKDMLARTEGPSMRVLTMHLSVPKDKLDAQANTINVEGA